MPLSEAALASSNAKTFDEWLDREVRTDGQEVVDEASSSLPPCSLL